MKSNCKAFSLVELMVVIVIIGVLAGIAVPTYGGYVRKVKFAEGNLGINILTKNQVKFYLENKEFAYAPGKPRYVPKSKLPYVSEPDMTNDDVLMNYWSKVGFPVPLGAETSFNYQTYGGKNTSLGTPIMRGGGEDSWTTNVVSSHYSTTALLEGGGRCIVGSNAQGEFRTIEYLSPAGKPGYAWAFVIAIANMKLGEPGHDNPCTLLYKIIDLDSNGKVNASSPVVTLFSGE